MRRFATTPWLKEGKRPRNEGRHGRRPLVAVELDVGEARVVADDRVRKKNRTRFGHKRCAGLDLLVSRVTIRRMPRSPVVAALFTATLLVARCGSDGGDEAAKQTTGNATTTAAETGGTTTEGPQPITAAEKRYLARLKRYRARVDPAQRPGTITHGTMRARIRDFRACPPLAKPPSDRFRPVARTMRRACRTLEVAARNLTQAIAASEPGGGVVVGTPEQKKRDRALRAAFEAEGKGVTLVFQASARADGIRASIPSS